MNPGRRPTFHIRHPSPRESQAGDARKPAEKFDVAQASRRWLSQVCPVDDDFLAEAHRRWRIATGQEQGNPEESANRSKVHRYLHPDSKVAKWCKEYSNDFSYFQTHEFTILGRLGGQIPPGPRNPRDFHAKASQIGDGRSTAIGCVITEDAGPNLQSWLYFQPMVEVGPHRWLLPMMAHPEFLAAMVYRLLLAVEVLFEHGVVHLDLKPENIGLALPKLTPRSGELHGQWPLQALPLKLLDFESCVDYRQPYPGMPPGNPYVSPFARARLLFAIRESETIQNQLWAQGVDWGADVYALGHMLAYESKDEAHAMPGSAVWALSLLHAYRQTQRNDPVLSPPGHDALGLAAEQDKLIADLEWLVKFGRKLMGLDRPVDQAAVPPAELQKRTTPHARLRQELAQRFPALQEGAQALRFFMADPDAQLNSTSDFLFDFTETDSVERLRLATAARAPKRTPSPKAVAEEKGTKEPKPVTAKGVAQEKATPNPAPYSGKNSAANAGISLKLRGVFHKLILSIKAKIEEFIFNLFILISATSLVAYLSFAFWENETKYFLFNSSQSAVISRTNQLLNNGFPDEKTKLYFLVIDLFVGKLVSEIIDPKTAANNRIEQLNGFLASIENDSKKHPDSKTHRELVRDLEKYLHVIDFIGVFNDIDDPAIFQQAVEGATRNNSWLRVRFVEAVKGGRYQRSSAEEYFSQQGFPRTMESLDKIYRIHHLPAAAKLGIELMCWEDSPYKILRVWIDELHQLPAAVAERKFAEEFMARVAEKKDPCFPIDD